MAVIVAFVVLGVVLAIAGGFVMREAARMSEVPPLAVFDPDDAYAWVIERLDDLVASTLTPDDLRRILDFELAFFESREISQSELQVDTDKQVSFDVTEVVDYIELRCRETGEAYLREQIKPVVLCQVDYLGLIGAMGSHVESEQEDVSPNDIAPA